MAREGNDKELLAEADERFSSVRRMEQVELQSLLSSITTTATALSPFRPATAAPKRTTGPHARTHVSQLLSSMGWEAEELHRTPGTETGIKEFVYHVRGPFAYGYMNCERGAHRLARVSPFNAQGKRQTCFATVDVTPEIEDIDLDIPGKDSKSCPSSALRPRRPERQQSRQRRSCHSHPNAYEVVTSTFRDQPQNRKQALTILGQLELIEDERREAELDAATGGKANGLGTQTAATSSMTTA